MSKEEILKIQKCVLKVNIHCDGCKHKVKKILQKIDGVFTTEIDAEQGKVTVTGNVDPNVLIKKLAKSGKHAELWGAPKPNNNNNSQNYLVDQLKNMQINHPKGGGNHNNSKGQNQKGGGNNSNNNNQAKGGGGQQGPTPQQQQQLQLQQQQLLQQQLQQIQRMKGLQDLNLPQFKDLKLPPHNPNAKSVKFDIPEEEEEDFSDDELDDFDDDDDFQDEFDDAEMDYLPPNKMKLPPMMMNAPKGGNNGSGGYNGKKGGPVPIEVHGIPDGGGKKGNSSGGNNLNQGGGNKNNGNKNGGGVPVGKNGGGNKNNNGGGNNNNNNNGGSKKGNPMAMGGVGVPSMNSGFQNIGGGPQVMSGPMSTPIPAVQGLPAAPVNGGGYFRGAGPDAMQGNPFHQQQQLQLQQQQQQQYMAAMMNQQGAMGNDRFQPMMYARPPPAVNYMYPPYPYPPPDPYTHFFSDENTSSCIVM